MQKISLKITKTKKVCLILTIYITLLTSCSMHPKKNIIEEIYYDTNNLKSTMYYLEDDSFPVYFEEYYYNGNLKAIGCYDSFGQTTGRCMEYYWNGLKKIDCNFIKGGCLKQQVNLDSVFMTIETLNLNGEIELIKMLQNDTIITYKNSLINFYPYSDGMPYGTYQIYFTSKHQNGYIEVKTNNSEYEFSAPMYFETLNKCDTIDVYYMFPNKDFKIVLGDSSFARFTFIVK